MKFEKDKRYMVDIVVSSSSLPVGQHVLYFRDLFLNDGLPVFNFSESLDYNSRYYNLFYPYDIFTVSPDDLRQAAVNCPAGCPCEAGRDPRAPL